MLSEFKIERRENLKPIQKRLGSPTVLILYIKTETRGIDTPYQARNTLHGRMKET